MKNYASYSYWLESCDDDLTPRPALRESIDVDIAILGAGYSGLWIAYYQQDRLPSLKISIVEQEIAGYGASGRNGGWCTAGFPTSLGTLGRKYGRDTAIATHRAMAETVDEVGRVAEAEHLDLHYEKGGSLLVARGLQQLPAVEETVAEFEKLGLGDRVQFLDKAATDARVKIAGSLASVHMKDTATIHPGRLVRGLARVVERRGTTIYEQTTVTDYSIGAHPALHTVSGDVRAKTIVLAGEAYLTRLPKLKRQLIPVYSLITLTEPLSDSDWDEIGWD